MCFKFIFNIEILIDNFVVKLLKFVNNYLFIVIVNLLSFKELMIYNMFVYICIIFDFVK